MAQNAGYKDNIQRHEGVKLWQSLPGVRRRGKLNLL